MGKRRNQIIMYQHPEEIFDRPYREVVLSTESYQPMYGGLNLNLKENRLVIESEEGRILEIAIFKNGIVRLQAYRNKEDVIHATYMTEINKLEEETELEYKNTRDKIEFGSIEIKVVLDKETKDISIWNGKEEVLKSCYGGFLLSDLEPEFSGVRSLGYFEISDEEHFFGFGGRTAKPDRRGNSADMFNVKAGVVSGDYGGCAVPFFVSTKGYGFFLNNPWPHVYFDMGRTRETEWFFHAPGGNCDIFLIAGNKMGEIVEKYTQITGRIPVPPKWMFGFWASSLTIKNADELLETARRFREEEYPCDVLLIDAQWRVGPEFLEQYTTGAEYKSNDIDWSPNFGDKDKLLKELKKLHFKLGLHLNSRNYSEKTERVGIEEGYLCRHNDEVVANFLDSSGNEKYQEMIEKRIKDGVDVWWIDHSDRVGGEIAEGIPRRNLLGIYWCKSVDEVMARNQKEANLAFTRGNGIGGQRYGFPWPGDTSNGIEHFVEDLWYVMNAGITGYPISSVDLGGFNLRHLVYGLKYSEHYKNDQDIYDEVFHEDNILRRVCQSLICIPIPRIHNNWCTPPKLPWNCNDKMARVYREFLKERYRLIPYYYHTSIVASKTGEPVLKPLVYEFWQDRKAYTIQDECLLGQSLLVAPIVEGGVTSRSVYLPEGTWYNMWDDRVVIGPCTIEVEAPLTGVEGLPMFIKGNSIIPRQDAALYTEKDIPEYLLLDFYIQEKGTGELNFYESESLVNQFCAFSREESYDIYLENQTDRERKYRLRLHHVKTSRLIRLDGCQVENIQIDRECEIIEVDVLMEAGSRAELSLEKLNSLTH